MKITLADSLGNNLSPTHTRMFSFLKSVKFDISSRLWLLFIVIVVGSKDKLLPGLKLDTPIACLRRDS